jgi:hypothetical protein
MRRLNKTVPFVLILVVFMFLPGCIGQEEEGMLYEGPDVLVQAGNSLPKFQFAPSASFPAVPDVRMGAGAYGSYTWFDLTDLYLSVNTFTEFGTWRLDTCLEENEGPIFWEYSNEEEFPEGYDKFIDGMNDNGVIVNYMLHFWDKTGHALGEELSTPRFQTEEQIQDFLNYTRFVVNHYQGRVQYYTIWSEPDCCSDACGEGGIKCIWPRDYLNLVRRTVPVIHEEDPNAKIAIAPVVLFFARNYLKTVIESDLMTMVDVVQWNGIFNVLPNDSFYGDYYYQYPSIIEGIRDTATAHGFDGEYWSCGISYSSVEYGEDPAEYEWGVPSTGKQAAKYSLRAIVMHLGLDIGISLSSWLPDVPELTPWVHRTTSRLYKVLAGTKPIELAVELEGEPANTVNNTFKLPNGDILFSFWTHGEAVDDDSGVSTTLTFPGLSAQQVIAIDTLNGFEQELITEVENESLAIRGIFVRDYPIILHINNDTSTITSQDQFPLMQLGIVIGVPVVVVGVLVLWEYSKVRKGAA